MARKMRPVRAIFLKFDPLEIVFFAQFWVHFLATFWPSFGPPLDLFGCLLGTFSGLLRFSWEASGSKNNKKLNVFWGFWKCSFLALWSSWWLSWAHLAPSLADLVPKWAPKNSQNCSKSIPKFDHSFFCCFFSRPFLGLKNGARWSRSGRFF